MSIHPLLLDADRAVLQNLFQENANNANSGLDKKKIRGHDDQYTMETLSALKRLPMVFTTWDLKDLEHAHWLNAAILGAYISWAQGIVRNPLDVVFLTHIILYLITSLPSALYLFYRFNMLHGILHWLMQLFYGGSFTLMLHNHIHNDGVFAKKYVWFDQAWPYILEPLMGHTWDSYYYHHVKHHHVENNGPEDLSSTIRYQRDEFVDFLIYVGRFIFFIWIELPLYFFRKQRPQQAIRVAVVEVASYAVVYALAKNYFYPTLFVFIMPLLHMRLGMMIGNWGQHALVDDLDPKSSFRSSITLIDVTVGIYLYSCVVFAIYI